LASVLTADQPARRASERGRLVQDGITSWMPFVLLTLVPTGQEGVALDHQSLGLVICVQCLEHNRNGRQPKTASYFSLSAVSITVHSMRPSTRLGASCWKQWKILENCSLREDAGPSAPDRPTFNKETLTHGGPPATMKTAPGKSLTIEEIVSVSMHLTSPFASSLASGHWAWVTARASSSMSA
jgi:hypothetical protein